MTAIAERINQLVQFDSPRLMGKYRDVRVSIVHVTPELAEFYLRKNTKNRNINKTHVTAFERILSAGEMVMNGEAIILSVDGTLLDGQHRLTACVRSGVGFDAMVVEGIDVEAFKTIDGGRKRTLGDVLSVDGEVSSKALASAIVTLVAIGMTGGRNVMSSSATGLRNVTGAHAERILSHHPRLRDSVLAMHHVTLYRNQVGTALHYLFSVVSQRLADDFASVLSGGSEDIGRPFNLFRESLISASRVGDLRRSNAAKAIKAFNAELSGARPKLLRLNSVEEFPLIDGLDYEALAESVK
jgi:hypothetical protein